MALVLSSPERLVGLADLQELVLRLRIVRLVRMVLHGQPVVRLLQLTVGGCAGHAEDLVVVGAGEDGWEEEEGEEGNEEDEAGWGG